MIKTILNALRTYKLDINSWTKSWEKDKGYISAMQEVNDNLNTFNIALSFVKPNSKVLACGCGPGREAKILVNKGCKLTAIDHSKNMIEESKKNEPKAKYILGDIKEYVKPDSYDYITCLFNTINFLGDLENRRKFVNNSHRNLKRGGKLIIDSSDRTVHWKVFLRSLIFKYNFYYNPSQIDSWFKGTGFKVEKMKTDKGNLIIATKIYNHLIFGFIAKVSIIQFYIGF